MQISTVSFKGCPSNYVRIDDFVSRSAQPDAEDFLWLKKQGVTDVFNFRTSMFESEINEKEIVENLGMKYHHIPSYTRYPCEKNIMEFLNRINIIKQNKGKAHIHCKAGADRTGMYAFVYKMLNKLGSLEYNKMEFLFYGHHQKIYPELMQWTEDFVKTLVKK